MKIYTKTGDSGETGILSGKRVKKSHLRIVAYGEVDELNAFLSLCLAEFEKFDFSNSILINDQRSFLKEVQSLLFSIGALVACPSADHDKFKLSSILESDVSELEVRMDQMNTELPALKNFIIPGGSAQNASLHICRTVCRRAERACVHFNESEDGDIPQVVIKYINRLSDYFFVLSRFVLFCQGEPENCWVTDTKK